MFSSSVGDDFPIVNAFIEADGAKEVSEHVIFFKHKDVSSIKGYLLSHNFLSSHFSSCLLHIPNKVGDHDSRYLSLSSYPSHVIQMVLVIMVIHDRRVRHWVMMHSSSLFQFYFFLLIHNITFFFLIEILLKEHNRLIVVLAFHC